MAYRNIVVESPARISVKNDQLIVQTDGTHSVPIEDISALMLESERSTITTAALSRLGQCGCAVYVCDGKHLPCAVLEPYHQHSRDLSVVRLQLGLSAARKNQLWKSVVKAKLKNQARCLELAEKKEALTLFDCAERVRSGDPENIEATGATVDFLI